ADCLCSDYAPSTLLPALFRIARELDWPLHRVARLTGLGPAAAARLADRGAIREGLRADLIAVHQRGGVPVTRHVWTAGRPTLTTG
ncbi:MAG: phosphonate metabolism protein PhnM, partial [Capsulimonadales bacterium]|nr:phosphonate metabolism protein PhnM [Capsulimonadales bacterium]